MKRLLKVSMCFLLMLGVSGLQGVKAEETTYTEEAEKHDSKSNNEHHMDIKQLNGESYNTYSGDFSSTQLILLLPKQIVVKNYDFEAMFSDPSMYDEDCVTKFEYHSYYKYIDQTIDSINLNSLIPIKEGTSTINMKLTNRENKNDYYEGSITLHITDSNKGKVLVADKTEFTLKPNELVFYYQDKDYKEYVGIEGKDTLKVGLKDAEGNVEYNNLIHAKISNPDIALSGLVIPKKMLHSFISDLFPLKNELDKFLNDYSENTLGDFLTLEKFSDLLASFEEKYKYPMQGWGAAGIPAYAIVPVNVGSTYVTFSYGTQSVKVKINVTNLSDEPIEALPTNLAEEFNSDANEKVNVTLTKADTVKSDVFTSAKETGKDVTFNILDEKNRTQYSWTFNGATITNPSMDLDLSLTFTSNKENEIQALAKNTDLFYLTFAHHGELPGVAKMKVDVSSKYKDGDEIYLYYYNEEKGTVEQTGNKVLVKDGYAEFEISHCSTYFLTSKLIEETNKNNSNLNDNTGKTESIDSSTLNVNENKETPLIDKKEVVKSGDVATGDSTNTMPFIIFSLSALLIMGFVVTLKSKHS